MSRQESPPTIPLRIWLVYLGLFALSVPWYLPTEGTVRLWLGLPHWVVISLLSTLCIAVLTVFVIRRHWSELENTCDSAEEERPQP